MASQRRLAANLCSGIATNLVRAGVQLVMLPVMARLLGPAELGIYALAMPVVTFVLLLSDAGIGDSLAKERNDDPVVWSSAFWGLIAAAIAGMIAVNGAAQLVAHWSARPELPRIMLPLSLTLPLVAVTIVPTALMVRAGNVVPASLADMLSHVLGAATGIAMAVTGFGVWALVAQYVCGYAVRAVAYNIAQPFLPRLCFRARSLLSHTGMGGQILLGRLGDLGTSMTERSRIARLLGPVAVGGYTNASQIGIFLSNTVGSPLWTNIYYVAINKPGEEVATAYRRAHRVFALLVFPAAALLAAAAPAWVPLMFGPSWTASVGSVAIMLATAPFGNLATFQSAILYARGEGQFVLIGLAGPLLFRIAVVFLWWRWGIAGLSFGLGLSSIGYYLGSTVLTAPLTGVRARELFAAVALPLIASVAAGGGLFLVLAGSRSPGTLLWALPAAGLAYLAILVLADRDTARAEIDRIVATFAREPAVA